MSNNNKKIVLNAEKELRKKVIKKYRKENRYDFIFLLILQCYVLTLFILSIATDSSFLSLILAIFSLITTFSFEALEWIDFKSKSVSSCLINYILKNKTIIMLLIPLFFLITMTPLFICTFLPGTGTRCTEMYSHPNSYTSLHYLNSFANWKLSG